MSDVQQDVKESISMTEEDLRLVLEMAVLIAGRLVTSAIGRSFFYKSRKHESPSQYVTRMNLWNAAGDPRKEFEYAMGTVLDVISEAGKAPSRGDDE